MTNPIPKTDGKQSSEFRLQIWSGGLFVFVLLANAVLEAIMLAHTGIQYTALTDIELGMVAAVLGVGSSVYTAARTSKKNAMVKALSPANTEALASLAKEIVSEAAKKRESTS